MTPIPEADNIDTRILAALARGTHVDVARLAPEATLESLAITSLDVVNALFEIEDEFKIEVPMERDEPLATVGDVMAKVRKLVAASTSA